MLLPHLLYNGLLLAADVAILLLLSRRRDAVGLGLAVVGALAIMGALAVGGFVLSASSRFSGSIFLLFGLLAWGLFLHGPLLAVGAAAILRRERRRLAAGCVGLALVLVVVAVQSMVVEPRWLEVTHHEIASAKLTRPVRVVVLSDLQASKIGNYERAVLRRAMEMEPDLVLFPGDYLHTFGERAFAEEVPVLRDALAEAGLRAPLGVFAVGGNVDRPGWPEIFAEVDAVTLAETRTVLRGELAITGLSFGDSRDAALRVPGQEPFHIVLGHLPDFALGDIDADLLVAGHTHGGQVRIPGFGPLLTLSAVPRSWAAGRTELPGGRTLVVSRGIGLERGHAPRVRFFCRPELVVLDLVPAPR